MELFDFIHGNGQMDEAQAKNIFKQLEDAEDTMDASDVFHRDIKLENVLIETSSVVPQVWIIDLRSGCFATSLVHKSVFGTTELALPEVAACGEYKANPTTVWQLGNLLYEILHGAYFEPEEYFLRRQIDTRISHSKLKYPVSTGRDTVSSI
ncbi:serine/threonine-protein kinase pim-2-like isoform X3 [Syngnathoides biaculeatus]|nr:serine/threonine-protein kinase pim-2-like isoform X3 [Syngnathoides biaculeatus]